MTRRALPLVALAVIVLMIGACSQFGQQNEEAMKAAKRSIAAMADLDWYAYATTLHPEETERFRQSVLPNLALLAAGDSSDTIALFDKTFSLSSWRNGPAEQFFADVMTTIFDISPELKRSFSNMTNDFVGAVAENDTLVHVVVHTKMQIGMQYVDEMNVTTVRKYENEWRPLMSSKIEGIEMMLRQSIGMQQTP